MSFRQRDKIRILWWSTALMRKRGYEWARRRNLHSLHHKDMPARTEKQGEICLGGVSLNVGFWNIKIADGVMQANVSPRKNLKSDEFRG